MKVHIRNLFLVSALLGTSILAQAKGDPEADLIEKGRYIVKVTGCNDCHTPGYGERNGEVPEQNWLIGVGVGFRGPWGTTYAPNLRHAFSRMSEERWVRYAKRMKAKPPMPWFNVNAMSTDDLRAMYHFIRSLGDSPNRVPEELAPGVEPQTPYINYVVIQPQR